MSAAGRKAIAAAQKARWAKINGKSSTEEHHLPKLTQEKGDVTGSQGKDCSGDESSLGGEEKINPARMNALHLRTWLCALLIFGLLAVCAPANEPKPTPYEVGPFVSVEGRVIHPGNVSWKQGLTLTGVITQIGGTFGGSSILLARGDQHTRFRLNDLVTGRIDDPILKAGDKIEVR